MGERVNYGVGSITANYDGAHKHRTIIEADVHVGSNCVLIAPVTIGAGGTVGGGTTLTKDTAAGAHRGARAPGQHLELEAPEQMSAGAVGVATSGAEDIAWLTRELAEVRAEQLRTLSCPSAAPCARSAVGGAACPAPARAARPRPAPGRELVQHLARHGGRQARFAAVHGAHGLQQLGLRSRP